ncbi:hypothetical protein GGS23DRAFT_544604 [Durotheca rogersii]|uniref:uncharacterized protein n=1 Tax=Durotheca rogersii TaxID=419775 RepID=UPI00222050C4|nr:uncharacterized protein GGS23DRAFT_544604 [Durotheca rogersii]KAI5868233.1 hypothetical protein GGS23DRAFT_544604 [Durotheca rogersii]
MRKDASDIQRRNYGHFDTFETAQVRPCDAKSSVAQKRQACPVDVDILEPPALAAGLTMLNVAHTTNIRVDAFADNITVNSANLHINTWHDSELLKAACTWFHVAPHDQDIQTGQFATPGGGFDGPAEKTNAARITFPHEYAQPPRVIVWLNQIDMRGDRNCRIFARADEITRDGFTIRLETWGDSVLHGARASWIAHRSDMRGVASGTFGTTDARPPDNPQKYTSGRASFPAGAFRGVPTVLAALNALDVKRFNNLRVRLRTDSACEHGFSWHIDSWVDTALYSGRASFIAFDT